MSMKTLQGCRTPGSRDECRTAQRQTAADSWNEPTDLSHWPACMQLRNSIATSSIVIIITQPES